MTVGMPTSAQAVIVAQTLPGSGSWSPARMVQTTSPASTASTLASGACRRSRAQRGIADRWRLWGEFAGGELIIVCMSGSAGRGVPADRPGPIQVGEGRAREDRAVALGELLRVGEAVAGQVMQPARINVEAKQLPRLFRRAAAPRQITDQDANRLPPEPAARHLPGGGDVVDQHDPSAGGGQLADAPQRLVEVVDVVQGVGAEHQVEGPVG